MTATNEEHNVRLLMGVISQAFIQRDVSTLSRVFSDDFTLVDPYGSVVSKSQWLDDVASGELAIESVQSDAFEIRQEGDAMHVRGRLTLRARYSKSNYNGSFRYLGVYRRCDDGEWRLQLSSAARG